MMGYKLALLAFFAGIALRDGSTYLTQWKSFRSSFLCADVYSGPSEPILYNAADLWQHADPFPGLAHLTVAGSTHHGMRQFEVWMQTLAPGRGTPIHSHHCEEVNLVLKGKGHILYADKEGQLVKKAIRANDTSIAPANTVYQMVNSGSEALSLLVIMGCAPASISTYPTFDGPADNSTLVFPMMWDRACPPFLPDGLKQFAVKTPATSSSEL